MLQYDGRVSPKLLPVNKSVSFNLYSGSRCEYLAKRQWINSSFALLQAILIAQELKSFAPNLKSTKIIQISFKRFNGICESIP